MNNNKPYDRLSSIVLIGSFNPQIFQPNWFQSEGLIRASEEREAKIQIIHREIVQFDLDWLRLEVTHERFSAATTQEPYDVILRDLVINTFSILSHTPIRQMGINLQMQFDLNKRDRLESLIDNIAPVCFWENILNNVKLRSITVQEEPRIDGLKGNMNVKIEPSLKLANEGKVGVLFDINDHIEVVNPNETLGSHEIIDTLTNKWNESYSRSNKLIYSLLERI